MAAEKNEVRHDAASLHLFVSSIADACDLRNPAVAYLTSSERFFNYISALASATRRHVEGWQNGRGTITQLLNLRSEIATLRAAWTFLHRFVKPALDADTLRIPSPLISGLISRFREISAFTSTDFVIFHTDEFNYLHVTLTAIKNIADRIATIVKGPSFPTQLGLIGIPYSQSAALFTNCLIPHEMGHFTFGHFALSKKFLPRIDDELKKGLGKHIAALERGHIAGIVVRWIEELFCDLFALRFVGPCYSLAYIELFDVARVLGEDDKLSITAYGASTEFTETYPPDFFRVRQQFKLAQDEGWWDELKVAKSHYVKCYEALGGLADSVFGCSVIEDIFGPGRVDPMTVLSCFYSQIPSLLAEVNDCTKGINLGVDQWREHHKTIRIYLECGVVPSTLRKDSDEPAEFPSLVSLLNSTYTFYLESLDALMSHIQQTDPDDIASRSTWALKLQSWTMKAIEDIGLLQRKS